MDAVTVEDAFHRHPVCYALAVKMMAKQDADVVGLSGSGSVSMGPGQNG